MFSCLWICIEFPRCFLSFFCLLFFFSLLCSDCTNSQLLPRGVKLDIFSSLCVPVSSSNSAAICRLFTDNNPKREFQYQLTTYHNSITVYRKREHFGTMSMDRSVQYIERAGWYVGKYLFMFLQRVRWEDWRHSHICKWNKFSFILSLFTSVAERSLYLGLCVTDELLCLISPAP